MKLPEPTLQSLHALVDQLASLRHQIGSLERHMQVQRRLSEASHRIETILGIGVVSATAIMMTVNNSLAFKSRRALAAWIGPQPGQHLTTGKPKRGAM